MLQDALDLIDNEVDLLGTVMNDQQQTLSLQMTQLALEMTTTTRKLCQSFRFIDDTRFTCIRKSCFPHACAVIRYQTTRLFRECVGPNRAFPDDPNDMNDLCGGIGDAFVNQAMPPSELNENTAVKVMEFINDYLTTYDDVYAQATAVTDKVNNRLWGGASVSAIDNTFVDVKIKPWAPPPCDGTNGYVEETNIFATKTSSLPLATRARRWSRWTPSSLPAGDQRPTLCGLRTRATRACRQTRATRKASRCQSRRSSP